MSHSPFTLRSDSDLIETFQKKDRDSVVIPKHVRYPTSVQHYFAWTEPSGVYTYLVFKRPEWEVPKGIVFQKNGSGHSLAPAGMCDWCHTCGPSDEVGLMTTTITSRLSGGTWLCLDLSCLQKIEEQTALAGRGPAQSEKLIRRLCQKIADFYQRVRADDSNERR